MKAALASRRIEYPFTHDLRELLEIARTPFPELEPFSDSVPEYTEFAVRLRYDDLPWLTHQEAQDAMDVVVRLQAVIAGLI